MIWPGQHLIGNLPDLTFGKIRVEQGLLAEWQSASLYTNQLSLWRFATGLDIPEVAKEYRMGFRENEGISLSLRKGEEIEVLGPSCAD